MLRSIALLTFCTLVGPVFGAETLKVNLEESSIGFLGKKTDGEHEGGFKEFTAEAKADFENPANSSLTIEIDATTLWSDDDKLTNHLKNADFFDVRKFPTITFTSTELAPGDDGKMVMKGEMVMLDKTVEVEIPIEADVTEKTLTLNATFEIDRTLWGMEYGVGKINKEVEITTKLVFDR